MRPALASLLLLAACAPEAQELVAFEAPGAASAEEALGDLSVIGEGTVAPRNALTLAVDPLVPGDVVAIGVDGLAPNETAYVAYSLDGVGAGPCPAAMGGQCLDLRPPVTLLGTAQADATGVAVLSTTVPATAPIGLDVSLQAVAIRGVGGAQTVTSAAVTETVGGGTACVDVTWEPVAVPAQVQGSTLGQGDDTAPTCAPISTAPDIAVAFVPPVSGPVTLQTAGSAFDTVLYVIDGCGGRVLGCNDDVNGTLQSSVTVNATAGVPLIVVVDGYSTYSGAFTLTAR